MVSRVPVATWPAQQVATGTLETIVEARDEVGIEPPAITVIGEVAGIREEVLGAMVEHTRGPMEGRDDDA
jgi:uroporphyrin-III C-methyltransferase